MNKTEPLTCCELLEKSLPNENIKSPPFEEQMDKFWNSVKKLAWENKLCHNCTNEYYWKLKAMEEFEAEGGFEKYLGKFFWTEEGSGKEKPPFQKKIEEITIKHLFLLQKEVNEEAEKELGYKFAKKDIEKLLEFMKKVLNSESKK